jgi:hypothetical protein
MNWRLIIEDLLVLGGLAAISYGAWLAYHPAGFMAAGIGLLACVVELPARKPRQARSDREESVR